MKGRDSMNSYFLPIILAYFVGAIPSGYWLSKYLFKHNIHIVDGQMGTKYIYRKIGIKASILTFIIDFLKGYMPIRLVIGIDDNSYLTHTLMILAIIIGHNYSIFLRFKGGKGIASSFGCFSVFPLILPIIIVCQYLSNELCKISTLYSIIPLSFVTFIFIDPFLFFVNVPIQIRFASVITIFLFVIKTLDDPMFIEFNKSNLAFEKMM